MRAIFILSLLLISCGGNTTQQANIAVDYHTQVQQVQSDSLLVGIQGKIYDAFVQSMMTRDVKPLSELRLKLEELNEVQKQNLILYWRSYLQFYSSIYYLEVGDDKTAEKEIDKGIDWLEAMKNKNSEDYALLSMLQGFSIQFKGIKAMFISSKIRKSAKQAIAVDSTNIRAYYVYASNDFYTPEKYGGGKKAEKYLLKAIALPAQKVKNDYLPSWGKEESYDMLIKLYIKKKKWETAKKYFAQGIKEYPQSYTLKQLASKLVGK